MKATKLMFNGKQWLYKQPKRVVLNGRQVDGKFDFTKLTIQVRVGQPDISEMETDVHEIDHVVYPELPEGQIRNACREKTEAYWRLNYRKLTPRLLEQLQLTPEQRALLDI